MSDLFTVKVGGTEVLMIRCHWCGAVEDPSNKKIRKWASLFQTLFFCNSCVKDFVHKHG